MAQGLLGVLKPLSGGLWGQNDFYNTTERLLAFHSNFLTRVQESFQQLYVNLYENSAASIKKVESFFLDNNKAASLQICMKTRLS